MCYHESQKGITCNVKGYSQALKINWNIQQLICITLKVVSVWIIFKLDDDDNNNNNIIIIK